MHNTDITQTFSSNIKAPSARDAILGMDNIRTKLMDTPTNINPVKVAAADATDEKKLFH
jgi:hypothetical protein